MSDDDAPEGTTNMMLHHIQINPGIYLRKIKEDMKISMGTTQYHLDKLEKMGKIISTRNGLRKFYFPIGVFQENEKEILKILGQETARELLMIIIENQTPTQKEIATIMKISGSSVNWHLQRLIAVKLVEEIKNTRYKRYRIIDKETSKYITTLMQNYYPHIWNRWSNRLIDVFLSLSFKEDKN